MEYGQLKESVETYTIIKHIGDVGNGCHVDCSMKHKTNY